MLRKLILKLFIALLPVIALISVNLYLNVSFANKFADYVVSGRISYTSGNYNFRRVERKIIEKQTTVPETLFLGTSPIMELGSEVTGYDDQLVLLPTSGFFVDWLGILGLYKKQGRGLPERIVFEPTATEIVNAGGGFYSTYGHIFKDTYTYFYGMKGIEKWMWYVEQIEGLIKENLQYKNFFEKTFAYKVYDHKEDSRQSEMMRTNFPDGHSIRSTREDESPPGVVTGIYSTDYNPDYYPEKMTEYFNDLKGFCADNGIEFVVLLIPIAPAYIDNFNTAHTEDNISVESIESYIRELAGDCLVRGTFSPYTFDFTNEDFIDEAHIKRDKLGQVWDYIK